MSCATDWVFCATRLVRIVLKARPTPTQLDDRLREPLPEGLEMYLDGRDINSVDWLPPLLDEIGRHSVPADFAWLVEGPVRSLDGQYFNLRVDSTANREVIDRLTGFGAAIGAHSACVHMISPTSDLNSLNPARTHVHINDCLPLTRHYVRRCLEAGMVPTVENVPPVGRMREGVMTTSPIGAPPEDLARLMDQVDGLRVTLDTSHAQLFLNAANGQDDGLAELRPVSAAMAASSSARDFATFVEPLRGRIAAAHVSDAIGVLGEGLPYGEGSMDLDAAVDILLGEAAWIVTETIEPDPDCSPNMRAAFDRIAARRAIRGAR